MVFEGERGQVWVLLSLLSVTPGNLLLLFVDIN